MRRTLPIATATVFTVLLLMASAPASADLGPDEVQILGVYADTPTVGFLRPSLTIEDPISKKISVCDNVCPVAPALPFTEAANPTGKDFKMAGDMVATVWVSANVAQLPVQGLSFSVRGSNGFLATATSGPGNMPMSKGDGSWVTIGATPTKFVLSGPASLTTVKADTKLSVEVKVSSIGVGRPHDAVPDGTSPVNIFVHYGTPQFATGAVFPINQDAGEQRIGCALRISLAQESLAFGFPTGTESLARAITGNATLPRVHNVLLTTEFAWGEVTTTEPMNILTDASFNVTIKAPTGTSAEPYFGPSKINGSSQVSLPPTILSSTSPPGITQTVVRFALPTAGTYVEAGRSIRLTLQVYSTNSPAGAEAALPGLQALFGSPTDPSGFLMAVESDSCAGGPAGTSPEGSGEPAEVVDPDANIGRPDVAQDDADEEEPETIVDDEEGAGTAQEATLKDVSVPASVPGPGVVLVLVGALAIVAIRRRW